MFTYVAGWSKSEQSPLPSMCVGRVWRLQCHSSASQSLAVVPCTSAHHQALRLPVYLSSGEHWEDLKRLFILPHAAPERRHHAMWCGVKCVNSTRWCDRKAQAPKWHPHYVHGAGGGTVLNKGNTAIPRSTSHFTQTIWEEHLPHISCLGFL